MANLALFLKVKNPLTVTQDNKMRLPFVIFSLLGWVWPLDGCHVVSNWASPTIWWSEVFSLTMPIRTLITLSCGLQEWGEM